MKRSDFPQDFIWGVATSAYQIEGAVNADGRGESIWDRFSATPGKVAGGDTGEVACDHYHLWEADLDLIQGLGVDAYRFSIAWSRIMPSGKGSVEPRGLDFYERLVDGLLERGIQPHVTLYHWELPQALEDHGGWLNRDTAHAFADYAHAVAGRLGDRPASYATLNEPWCSAFLGYGTGEHAPGHRDPAKAIAASHNLLLAHGLGLAALRETAPGAPAGIVLNFSPADPATESEQDRAAAVRHDGFFNRWFLDPVFLGHYPEDMLELYGQLAPQVQDADMELISAPIDFMGVNYYNRAVIRAEEGGLLGYTHVRVPGEYTAMDWEVHPDSLRELLIRLQREYGPAKLFITENGAAYDDVLADGRIKDAARLAYLQGHIGAVREASAAGVKVAGYFAWSLLDNFEWAHGFNKRFGVVHVDFETQVRTLKDSALWYRSWLQGGA